MKKMHQYLNIISKMLLIFLVVSFHACIVEYEDDQVKGADPVLVVDGFITNNEARVRITRSIDLSEDFGGSHIINTAIVRVERDDDVIFSEVEYLGYGEYSVKTEELNPSAKYRLSVELDGKLYQSEFLNPLITPPIDEIEVIKEDRGQPVQVFVSTHDPENKSPYYRWSYNEIWEFTTELFRQVAYIGGELVYFDKYNNTYWCWGRDSSKSLILGSTEKLQENRIHKKKLFEVNPNEEKLTMIYYISVKQYQIRQQAYDYFTNLQKNIEQTGSIFSPIPSETKGNINCVDNPDEIVVGYIEVSTFEEKELFVPDVRSFYEAPSLMPCGITMDPLGMMLMSPGSLTQPALYAPSRCLDCTERGTKDKPDFWPSDNF